MAIEGLDSTMAALNKKVLDIKNRTLAGMLAAGNQILHDAQVKTPVLTGNLKSDVSVTVESHEPPAVSVNFKASYALFVHENTEIHHRNGQAKFLESAVEDNKEKVVELIKAYAK